MPALDDTRGGAQNGRTVSVAPPYTTFNISIPASPAFAGVVVGFEALLVSPTALPIGPSCPLGGGLFGVPTCAVDGKLFWGFDGLTMLRAWCDGDPWFASGAWEQAAALPVAKTRGS